MPALARHLCLLVLLVVLASALPPAQPAFAQTFTVNSTDDDDDTGSNACEVNGCTLREAIRLANESDGADTIRFSVSGTIAPASPLDPLSDGGTTINADDRNFGVVLSGLAMVGASHGLRITSAGNVVRGLVIISFPQGTGFFSGGSGIFISGAGATGNAIYNNRIGIDAAGLSARGNQAYGVLLDDGASNNDIGGSLAGQANVISGNLVANVGIASVSGTTNPITNNRITGNRIGTNALGTDPVADANNTSLVGGVSIENYARGNRIVGNLIGGHTGNSRTAGIALFGDTVSADAPALPRDNVIVGNRIGVNDSGRAIPNRVGIFLLGSGRYGAIGTVIGDPADLVGGRNYIAGNAERGIEVEDTPFETGDTTIAGNYIGIAPNDTLLGNGTIGTGRGEGIFLGYNDGSSTRKTIVGPGNLIVGSRTVHIYIRSNNNIVKGNLIGTNPAGLITSATSSSTGAPGFGSGAASIWIENGSNNLIGGPTAADRNVIANGGFSVNSSNSAVMIDPAANSPSGTPTNCNATPCAASGNTVQGNYIGVAINGTARLNTNNSAVTDAEGIRIKGSNGNTVSANTISGFGRGIRIDASNGSVVTGNRIGTRASGALTSPLTNMRDGIRIVSGSGNRFENNLIAFNGAEGNQGIAVHGVRVGLSTSSASDNQFIGNQLVTNGKTTTNHGFFVQNSQRVLLSQNTTTGHFGDGIALDLATSGNTNMAAPTLSAPVAGNPVISGSAAGCGSGCTVEIFTSSVAENKEGPVYLTRATTGTGGNFNANITGCLGFITATVRDSAGNTSPFTDASAVSTTGACTAAPTLTLGAASPSQRPVDIGSSTTYVHTLSHNVPMTRTYNLAITTDKGWASGPPSVTLPPGGSATFSIVVGVPIGTAAGTVDITTVQASLGTLSSVTQTDRTTAQLNADLPAFPVVSPGQIRALGVGQTSIQFTHTVTNSGDLAGDFTVIQPTFGAGAPGTWTFGGATLGKTRLEGGERTTLTIVVNTPGLPPATDVTFSFRVQAGGQQSEPLTTDTIDVPLVRDFAFSAVAPTSQTSTVGSNVSYTYTITNTGNNTDSFQITPPPSTAPSSSITFSANPSGSFSLAAGIARQVTVTASIPTSTPATTYTFTAGAQVSVGGGGAPGPKTAGGTLIVTGGGAPQFVGAPTITPNPAPANTQTDVTIVHTVRNSGNLAVPFSFGSTRPSGWGAVSQISTCPNPVPITVGFTCTVTTVVRVPAGADAGAYNLAVSAVADNATNDVTATNNFVVSVAFQRALLFLPTPQEQAGTPGTQLSFTHTLTNTGNAADSFDLVVDQSLGGWTVSVTPTALLNLPRNTSRPVTVLVTIPGALPANALNQLTVTATSRGDSAVSAQVQDTARVLVADGADLSPGSFRTAPIGGVITFTHTLTNTGSSLIAYRIEATNSQASWAAPIVSSPTPLLNPGEPTAVTVQVAIPAGITGGISNTTTLQVYADGGSTRLDQEQDTTLVGNPVDVLITPDRVGTVPPNAETVFTHIVTNIGTTTDTYTVTVREATGLPAFTSIDLIDLAPGQSKEISITLRIPAGTRVGSEAFVRTTVASTTNPSIKDSAVGEFTVSLVTGAILATGQQRGVSISTGLLVLRSLTLENTGNSPDTFDLTYEDVAGQPGGVSVSLSPRTILLDRGATQRSISLRVTVPTSIPPSGVRQVRIIATSRLDPTARSSIIVELVYLDYAPPLDQRLYMPMLAR